MNPTDNNCPECGSACRGECVQLERCRGCGLPCADAVLCKACDAELAAYYDVRAAEEAQALEAEAAQEEAQIRKAAPLSTAVREIARRHGLKVETVVAE